MRSAAFAGGNASPNSQFSAAQATDTWTGLLGIKAGRLLPLLPLLLAAAAGRLCHGNSNGGRGRGFLEEHSAGHECYPDNTSVHETIPEEITRPITGVTSAAAAAAGILSGAVVTIAAVQRSCMDRGSRWD